jgi:apolipoprotein D and lipocalin family protein
MRSIAIVPTHLTPRLALGFAFAFAPLFAALPARAAEPVASVERLDITRYAGEWHEIARLPLFYQRHCKSEITAQYTLRDDGLVGVRNRCLDEDGEPEEVEGVARQDADHPGRLEVRFAPDWLSWLPLTWADYWVIALDPDYQWAMVGEPGHEYLWILSRTPDMPRARFEELKARAVAMGYDLDALIVSAPLR